MPRSLTFRLDEDLRSELEARTADFRVPVRRGKSEREAALSELLTLAAERLARDLRRGVDVVSGSELVPGLRQLAVSDDGEASVVAVAPPASRAAYEALVRERRVPTATELRALEADLALLIGGMRVRLRGDLFTEGDLPKVGSEGELVSARGKIRHKVRFEGSKAAVSVHPFDLEPAAEAAPTFDKAGKMSKVSKR